MYCPLYHHLYPLRYLVSSMYHIFQSTRVAAATKIQAAYRGHTVRKRHHWIDGKTTSERRGNTALTGRHDVIDEHEMKPASFPSTSHETRMNAEPSLSEGSSDDVQFTNIRPFHKPERLNNDGQVRRLFIGWLSKVLYAKISFIVVASFNV